MESNGSSWHTHQPEEDADNGELEVIPFEQEERETLARQLCEIPIDRRLDVLNLLATAGWDGLATQRALALRWLRDPQRTDQEIITALQTSEFAIHGLWGMLPFHGSKAVKCELNNNDHPENNLSYYYVCVGPGAHQFCPRHDFVQNQCPQCGCSLQRR